MNCDAVANGHTSTIFPMTSLHLFSVYSVTVSVVPSANLAVTDPSSFPKYAAFASPQKSPTSTTPVNNLIFVNSYSPTKMSLLHKGVLAAKLTSAGFCILSRGNGASTIKFPLSLTTGPAFAFPILSVRTLPCAPAAVDASAVVGDPRSARRRRTET
jgi:hypothetical protein